jgi:predicted ATPase
VLTGGPGGGKTTAADLFRREIGERVVVVPEAATMLFSGGFPRSEDSEVRKATQRAIYHVQRNLEDIQSSRFPGRILLCDRGTLDGVVYWPDGEEDFMSVTDSTVERELGRYDAVIFFETAAAGNISIEGGNPTRTETNARAVELDHRLREVWSKHPRFVLVPHDKSFYKKITSGLSALEDIVARLQLSH